VREIKPKQTQEQKSEVAGSSINSTDSSNIEDARLQATRQKFVLEKMGCSSVAEIKEKFCGEGGIHLSRQKMEPV